MERDFRKKFRESVLACVRGSGEKSFCVTVNGAKLRCKPNVEGGVNVYAGEQRRATKALTLDEFLEWAEEFSE